MNTNSDKIECIEEKNDDEIQNPYSIENILVDDEETPLCRLCYGTKYDDISLIEPCSCKGTMAKVHRQCLERWLSHSGSKKCELCLYEYECDETLRYGIFESMIIWMRQNGRGRYFVHECFLFLIMNIITLSMIALLVQAIRHIYNENLLDESLPLWYFVSLCVAVSLWVAILLLACAVFYNVQIRPWFIWWKSMKKITILANNNIHLEK